MLVATAALIMFAVYRAASNEINDSYCKFTQNHTLCQFKVRNINPFLVIQERVFKI